MSGPTPKYQPTFTTEQIEEAHRLAACHQAPHVQVQRAKMVLMLAEHPDISNPELGHQIDAHPNTIFKWRKDWTVHGVCVTFLGSTTRRARPVRFLETFRSGSGSPKILTHTPTGDYPKLRALKFTCFGGDGVFNNLSVIAENSATVLKTLCNPKRRA